MKKAFITIIMLGLLGVYAVGQEKSRICIFPPKNMTEDQQLSMIGDTMGDSISLTLRLLGDYEVVSNVFGPVNYNRESLVKFAKDERLDTILYGSTTKNLSGAIIFEYNVFDAQKGELVDTQSDRAESLFDIFDASDRIVSGLVDSISGYHVGYGSLVFISTGESGDYSLYIDGQYVGENYTQLHNVLYGQRQLRLEQERPFGTFVLYDGSVAIPENGEFDIVFEIPGFISEEEELETLFGATAGLIETDPDSAEERIMSALELIGTRTASNSLQELKVELVSALEQLEVEPEVIAAASETEKDRPTFDSGKKNRPVTSDSRRSVEAAKPETEEFRPNSQEQQDQSLDDSLGELYFLANAGGFFGIGPEFTMGLRVVDNFYLGFTIRVVGLGMIMGTVTNAVSGGTLSVEDSFAFGMRFINYFDLEDTGDKPYFTVSMDYMQMVQDDANWGSAFSDAHIESQYMLFAGGGGYRMYLMQDLFMEFGGILGIGVSLNDEAYSASDPNTQYFGAGENYPMANFEISFGVEI